MMGYGFMGGGIFGILILGLLIYLLVSLFYNSKGNRTNDTIEYINEDALETLKMRYVKGEISEEEFEKKKRVLNEDK